MTSRLAGSQQKIYLRLPKLTFSKNGYVPDFSDIANMLEREEDAKARGYFSRLTGEPRRGAMARARIPGRLDSSYLPSRLTGQDITLERPWDTDFYHRDLLERVFACYRYDLGITVIRELLGPGGEMIKKWRYEDCKLTEYSLSDVDVGDESGVLMETYRFRCANTNESAS